MKNLEIERKFLIDTFPDHLPLLEQATVWQGYISTQPVVRIRKKETAEGTGYRLCFKGEGTLTRTEVEMELSAEKYDALMPLLEVPPVRKDYRVYLLPDGKRLECSLVDRDTPTAFYYAEVEFSSVEEANVFEPPAFLGEEKTEDPTFTMSHYWERKKRSISGAAHVKKAEALFLEGYNCAQAVFGAFSEDLGIPFDTAMKLSSSFGGGVGRMREVCGAVSGMCMAAGLLYGYETPETGEIKAAHYHLIRELSERFKERNGSIICRDILASNAEVGGTPEARTAAYYASRPCLKCVHDAAEILDAFINAH